MKKHPLAVALAPALLAIVMTSTAHPQSPSPPARELLDVWRQHRVLDAQPPCLVHDDVMAAVDGLAERFGDRLEVSEVGRSFEGRPIRLLRLGSGARRILLWSQMHGDEPSATPAVLDLVDYLLSSRDERATRILDEFTLLVVPMLNPDGTERGTRRSAQGIDINRDARQRATPEARLLKRLRDEWEPFIGFNLHDQDRRKLVGDTGVLATQSVLAVAGDEEQTLTDGRRRAMRVCAVLVEAFDAFIPGGVGRFDEDWNERAFGDNLTAWGTPIVLMESGGMPAGEDYSFLAGLTFVGLVRSLDELARDDAGGYDIDVYRELPRNLSDGLVDVALRDLDLVVPGPDGVLRRSFSDLAFDVEHRERELACALEESGASVEELRRRGVGHSGSSIQEVGDTSHLEAFRAEALPDRMLVPSLRLGVEGIGARTWLTAETLDAWTALGVGEVVWRVATGDLLTVRAVAEDLGGLDRARIRVAVDGELPALRADDAPAVPSRPVTLAGVLEAIAGTEPDATVLRDVLVEAGTVRRFGEASFLLLAPTGGVSDDGSTEPVSGDVLDAVELGARQLESVWYRGRQLR